MPLVPKDLNEQRLMALAVSLHRVIRVHEYILKRLSLSDDEPMKKHREWGDLLNSLRTADTDLQVYFLGD